jgi:hypothetical protein
VDNLTIQSSPRRHQGRLTKLLNECECITYKLMRAVACGRTPETHIHSLLFTFKYARAWRPYIVAGYRLFRACCVVVVCDKHTHTNPRPHKLMSTQAQFRMCAPAPHAVMLSCSLTRVRHIARRMRARISAKTCALVWAQCVCVGRPADHRWLRVFAPRLNSGDEAGQCLRKILMSMILLWAPLCYDTNMTNTFTGSFYVFRTHKSK